RRRRHRAPEDGGSRGRTQRVDRRRRRPRGPVRRRRTARRGDRLRRTGHAGRGRAAATAPARASPRGAGAPRRLRVVGVRGRASTGVTPLPWSRAMPDLELIRTQGDRNVYAIEGVGTLRLHGFFTRSATAEAGGKTLEITRRGMWRRVVEAADPAGALVGEFEPRGLRRGGALRWDGREL